MIRYLILGLLRDGTARHGYALMKEHRDGSGFQMGIGNFYREIARLVTTGLVQTSVNPSGADPRRMPYRITERGVMEFDAWLARSNLTASSDYQDELSLRAFLLAFAGPTLSAEVMRRWREELVLRKKLYERAHEAASAGGGSGRGRVPTLKLLLGRRLRHVGVDLEFVEEFCAALESARAAGDKKPEAARRREPQSQPGRLPAARPRIGVRAS